MVIGTSGKFLSVPTEKAHKQLEDKRAIDDAAPPQSMATGRVGRCYGGEGRRVRATEW